MGTGEAGVRWGGGKHSRQKEHTEKVFAAGKKNEILLEVF